MNEERIRYGSRWTVEEGSLAQRGVARPAQGPGASPGTRDPSDRRAVQGGPWWPTGSRPSPWPSTTAGRVPAGLSGLGVRFIQEPLEMGGVTTAVFDT
jgi:hypothetical protein